MLFSLTCAAPSAAQELRSVPITGQSLGGFVIPVEPVIGDIRIEGVRAWTWTVDEPRRAQQLAQLGAISITSNWPDRIMLAL